MGTRVRFLLLGAVLLTLPVITATQRLPYYPTILLVQRVWTQDAGGNEKTTFAPGETIQLAARLNNLYGKAIPSAKLKITTGFYNDTKTVDIPAGVSTWTWNTTAPSKQGYTVTIQAYDKFSGVYAVGSRGFAVAMRNVPALPQEDRYAPSQFDIPETLSGYPVLAVLTEHNSACMKPGEKRIILQSPELWTEDIPHVFPKETIEEELQTIGLPTSKRPGLSITGPGVTREQLVNQLEQSYHFYKTRDCPTFELKPASDPGFLRIQNLDADDQHPDNNGYTDINGQSVILTAPKVGDNQQTFPVCNPFPYCEVKGGVSAFLNNGVTDKDYFLQVGFKFARSHLELDAEQITKSVPAHGEVIWAADSIKPGVVSNLQGHTLPISYIPGHRYYTTIAYTNGVWWTCSADLEDQATYHCDDHKEAEGTHLVIHRGTSVFAENWNKNADWIDGFDQEWIASDAKIYRNGIGQPWSFEHKRLDEACENNKYETKNTYEGAFEGNLTDGQTAKFKIGEIPLYCDYGGEPGVPIITKVEFPSSIVGDHHNEPGKVYFKDINAGVISAKFYMEDTDTCEGCMKSFSTDARAVSNFKEGWVDFHMWCETDTGYTWKTKIYLRDVDDKIGGARFVSEPKDLSVQCNPASGGGL
jgi:hypothetical protein